MKKLPFKPTALRRAATKPKPTQSEDSKDSDDDGLSLFRRSKEMAPIMAADQQRRWERHREAERKRLEAIGEKRPREDSSDSDGLTNKDPGPEVSDGLPSLPPRIEGTPVTDQPLTYDGADRTSELVTPPPSKRSRLDSSSAQKPILSSRLDIDEDPFPDASPTRRLGPICNPPTPSRNLKTESFKPQAKPNPDPITIDSDSEPDSEPPKPKTELSSKPGSSSIELAERTAKPPKVPSPPPVEEDEFAEYIRKAEEKRARQQALQANKSEEQPKEAFNIFITSTIPHTVPLQVRVLFNKPLRVVRDAWVKHQLKKGVSIQADDVTLTWNNKKVYNTSTLIGLGIRPIGNGRAVSDGQGSAGFRENMSSINVQAWTPELFQRMEQEQELQRKRDAGELSGEEDEKPAERIRFVIMLKGRDVEPLACKILPETTVETLISHFRQQRNVGSDKQVSLWWDGERLEEHVEMQDAEIEARDTIEVHID
ncbi:ubiquitin [Fusarium subglutinans]|uniref:Ubiquitin n=1 Tax=Gibberella subglutinans TaxID=42677 RepID=A0A8H5KKM3_GIBSU|nr:ubiquitin [Fusarium subglutinans]KAF5574136.1 ubiquitin [Fusarium subglutinans]